MRTFNIIFGPLCILGALFTNGATLLVYAVYLLARFVLLLTAPAER